MDRNVQPKKICKGRKYFRAVRYLPNQFLIGDLNTLFEPSNCIFARVVPISSLSLPLCMQCKLFQVHPFKFYFLYPFLESSIAYSGHKAKAFIKLELELWRRLGNVADISQRDEITCVLLGFYATSRVDENLQVPIKYFSSCDVTIWWPMLSFWKSLVLLLIFLRFQLAITIFEFYGLAMECRFLGRGSETEVVICSLNWMPFRPSCNTIVSCSLIGINSLLFWRRQLPSFTALVW